MTTFEPGTDSQSGTAIVRLMFDEHPATKPRSLAEAVQAAVCLVDHHTLRPVAGCNAGLASQPRALLAILSYCYARQIYGSTEVRDRMARDARLCRLCGNEFPGVEVLRRFRRENLGELRRCLMAALCFLAGRKVDEGVVTKVSRTHLSEETTRRITMARFIDSLELGGDGIHDPSG